ncbi:phage integrase central domain-containing protein [Chitinolyticbacter meiyuanensis]|uniref:phage integrase central domain-containing protein n=1 Tax=Chitinolyticbacter meiyuanensis TaxID=682798 RepID=UPI003571019E
MAEEWHTKSLVRWTPDHARRVLQRLEADIFPNLGPRAVDTLKTRDLPMLLRKVEMRGAFDLASGLRQLVTGIMR